MGDWIEVSSYKDIPIGNWLVQLEKESHGCDMQVIKRRENVSIIGDSFAFDHSKVLRYCALPNK